ncbi:unnamed protein product [Penicillium camemberti]|uniref:Str. FM013 n=1 Tax=Penicillium camemberti (strain FM 013) TaxID=1429867 RepID=A0A0G4PW76_PENC3|nr:unnamed protein product [Penicillium camemberti]
MPRSIRPIGGYIAQPLMSQNDSPLPRRESRGAQLSSSSVSPVSPHPIDEFRKHSAAIWANSKNASHAPDLGRRCIMRPIPDRDCGNRTTITPVLPNGEQADD